jgi:hypothetical protein
VRRNTTEIDKELEDLEEVSDDEPPKFMQKWMGKVEDHSTNNRYIAKKTHLFPPPLNNHQQVLLLSIYDEIDANSIRLKNSTIMQEETNLDRGQLEKLSESSQGS